MKELCAIEEIEGQVSNPGERLIPGVTHDTAEVVRHKSSYQLFRKIIESDLISGCLTGRAHFGILDLGCGVGHGTHMLADIPGAIVTGIDCSEDTIKYARTYYSRENITYIVADAARFLESMPEFDYVVSRHALEHIPNGITAAAASRFSARLMVNVPFQEAEGNAHHHVHFISEDSFLGYESAEILYEDLSGVTYYGRTENPTPNSIVCVSSKSAFPKVNQIISSPVPPWRPEFLQGRWLEVFDKIGDPDTTQARLDEAHQINQVLQSQLNEAHAVTCRLQTELGAMRKTVSWRVTVPLRAGRRVLDSVWSGFRNSPPDSMSGMIHHCLSRIRHLNIRNPLAANHARPMHEIFTEIYRGNYWGSPGSRSGTGSDLVQAAEISRRLPVLLNQIGAKTVLDIPCGDFHWMKEVDLDVDYTGADVVAEMIQRNRELYGNDRRRFVTLDLSEDNLPKVDLIFCRDVLVHFSFEDVFAALRNIKRSGSEYLLTTTFTARDGNIDIRTGQWRPLNLERPPFGFPRPILIINEKCTEGDGSWGDKSLGLWKVRDLQETTPPVQLRAHPTSFGRVLLFSYAFPPMQVQMTPAVLKPMGALDRYGHEVDVLCAAPLSPFLPRDESLLPYAEKHFGEVTRLSPPEGLLGKLRQRSNVLSRVPDLMAVMHGRAFDMLMSMNLDKYEAIVTWSPFHSINPVMVRLKSHRPRVRWLAQFSDPWVGNPLEWSTLTKLWNWWHEPNTVRTADFIVHSSRYSRDLMMHGHAAELINKTEVIPHAFDEELYPVRPKAKNERITLRYIGVLFGKRSPESLFQALNALFNRRPKLRGEILVELVGTVPPEMLHTSGAQSLPAGTIKHIQSVPYSESLEKMYDSDILLLIEADTKHNLFVPSKLSDYMGARTPIVGIAPPGGSEDILRALRCWHARPEDIDGIARAVEAAVDYVASGSQEPWCEEDYRRQFDNGLIAGRFVDVLKRMEQR